LYRRRRFTARARPNPSSRQADLAEPILSLLAISVVLIAASAAAFKKTVT
jgi:hypothetical protein